VRLLLDTHALLWVMDAPERLASAARDAISDGDNEVFVSVASIWELAIKAALGKIIFPAGLEESLDQRGYQKLGISFAHAMLAGGLPMHHRDPFDRMLIAQSLGEELTLVTRDEQFAACGVAILKA